MLSALTTPSKLLSSILIASSFGNVPEAITTILRNPDSALCSLDTMLVDDYHGSCQQLADIVRIRAGKVLTIRQDWGGSASTGASVWNGANMVSWYLENALGRDSLKDSSVIELGAGVGFSSLVAQALGSTDVVITDGNEDVLKLANTNIKINVPEDELRTIKTGRLRWNTEDEEAYLTNSNNKPYSLTHSPNHLLTHSLTHSLRWDFIIAADVTYLKQNRPLLFSTITKLSGPKTVTILSMEPRNVGEVEDVLEEAKKNGFSWKEERLPVDPVKSQCSLLCARLFLLTKM
jgi:predicted nicotinamide N-methyase